MSIQADTIPFDAVRLALNAGHCPDCGGKKFLAGPEGGLTQNIKCATCGAAFNYCPPCYVMPTGYAERIGASAEKGAAA